ncbi:ECU11_0505 [Encephalitozoon cuniculi GB-M1]|uniref:ECU11_0505 protein n=1 Tax=Encephalitozoon cuniculi (strain GB-M1) TaxID=284813 RepID=I7JU09_ENCCU|nr:uncharacterized protein ECU11_0505 [Encephalitozoon cuniculi GB-M1]CCI73994.1 ECU11_0505 [Encephalitozoon cuniculi GB-M1]
MEGSLEARISDVLRNKFHPSDLDVKNTTRDHMMHGNAGYGVNLETHFYVRIKSAAFNGMVSASLL